MSRAFRVWISVEMTADEWRAVDIEDALEAKWPFKGFDLERKRDGSVIVRTVGEGNIGGGQPVEGFARELRYAVWKCLQRYTEVTVRALCLDDPPPFYGDELEFARARDSGLLSYECEDCGDSLPFGVKADRCAPCAAREAADIPPQEG